MKNAFVFPGQGSQKTGMGKEIYSNFKVARDVYHEVDEALGEKLSDLIFNGSQSDLTLTENAQPAIMVTSIALWRVMQQEFGIHLKRYDYVAGHSLGEYSALVASGALRLDDAARLLKLRGKSMQLSVPVGEGAMAALIGISLEDAFYITQKAGKDGICGIANINSAEQIVISGTRKNILEAIELAKVKGAKRAILLDVSAPFHCSLMKPAARVMQKAFKQVTINKPQAGIVSNVSAEAEHDPEAIAKLMVQQVTMPVRWMECVQFLVKHKTRKIIEVGAGSVLTGLNKRINPSIDAFSISGMEDFSRLTLPALIQHGHSKV